MKTIGNIYNFYTKVSEYKKSLSVLLLASMCSMTFAHSSDKAAGTVSFVIGKAFLSNSTSNKQKVRVTTGTPIFEGDNIITANGGHVHIRFIDNAMVSVRPNSALAVDYYQYDEKNPKASVIRFDLSKGVARSISGKGAKAARDKFRLNTPIAAIGVRGTDFVVSAKSNLIQAVVNEGAIVVAPFSAQCSSDSFGPCEVNSVELDGISKQLLEMSTLSEKPILVPLSSKFVPELMEKQISNQKAENEKNSTDESETETDSDSTTSSENNDTSELDSSTTTDSENQQDADRTEENTTNADSSNDNELSDNNTESTTDEENNEDLNDDLSSRDVLITNASTEKNIQNSPTTISTKGNETDSLTDLKKDRLEEVIDEVGGINPPPENYVPQSPLNTDELSKRQLVWGRWSDQTKSTDRIVATRSEISNGRVATVGTTEYILYRSHSSNDTVVPNLGDVRFNLVDAQAIINIDGRQEIMSVSDGWLNINFNNSTFDTGLSLNHTLTSEISLESTGSINDKGFFNNNDNGTRISGASTLDGSEASYLFQKEIDLGTIEGLTYWNGKP